MTNSTNPPLMIPDDFLDVTAEAVAAGEIVTIIPPSTIAGPVHTA